MYDILHTIMVIYYLDAINHPKSYKLYIDHQFFNFFKSSGYKVSQIRSSTCQLPKFILIIFTTYSYSICTY